MMATDSTTDSRPSPVKPAPWWRFKMVWFVLGLPATVVVASLFTAGIAWTHIDPLVTDPQPSRALAADDVAEHGQRPGNAMEPAVTARNHAATPGR